MLTDVLRFDICMYKVTFVMQILKTQQYLLGNDLYECRRDTQSLVSFYESEQVLSERLKDKTDMDVLWTAMLERVQERDDVIASCVARFGIHDLT